MKLIFDLDGTILDSKKRLYQLFQSLTPESNLTYEDYWKLKYSKLKNEDILEKLFQYTKEKKTLFIDNWMSLIETDDYLKFDKPIPGVVDALQELSKENEVYLCTARQSKSRVLQQLEEHQLQSSFKKVLVTAQTKTKAELIFREIDIKRERDWIIGDTGHDVQTGKELNLQTCAVCSGFMDGETLRQYNPDKLINSVADFHLIKRR